MHRVQARIWLGPYASVVAGLAAAVAFLTGTPASGQSRLAIDQRKAAAVKAAYLRYLSEFAEWPEGAFESEDAPLVIGIVGDDPYGVGDRIEAAMKDGSLKTIQKRPIELKRLSELRNPGGGTGDADAAERTAAALGTCRIVFLTASEGHKWADWRRRIESRPVLTVSEITGFAEKGGMVEFAVSEQTRGIGMRINLDAIEAAGLKLSSRVLGLKQGVEIMRP